MRCARPALIAPVLFGLLASSGCYGPYQQSPYGPYGTPPYGAGGYPGVGGPPIQTLQPGGTYTPSGVAPQGTYSSPTPTPIDQTGGSGPFYQPQGTTQNYEGGVPTYDDASDTLQFHQQQHGSPGSTADQDVDSWGSLEGVSATVAGAARVDLETAQFVAPVPTVQNSARVATSLPEAPYAYDANYQWLRGVLQFDAESGTWIMTYSSNPAENDVHAGRLVVADAPELAPLKPQAVVLLQGEVDSALSDAAGRAVYRVDAVETVEFSLP